MGPNKFYGNISFIGRQAALFGNKGLWGGGGGGRVSQYTLLCPAFPQWVLSMCCPDTLHCKGSQWVTQWVTMLDVHRPHTQYKGHNGFDNGAGQERRGRGSHGFGQMLCFNLSGVVHRRCYLFIRHCVLACLACTWTFALAAEELHGKYFEEGTFLGGMPSRAHSR